LWRLADGTILVFVEASERLADRENPMFCTIAHVSFPATDQGDILADAIVAGLDQRGVAFERRSGFRHTVSVEVEAPTREALNYLALAHFAEVEVAAAEVGLAREVATLCKPIW
jgi:hypothetical protein